MSKQLIAAQEQQGISTPCTLANTPETVKEFKNILENRMLVSMKTATDHLDHTGALLRAIHDLARHAFERPDGSNEQSSALTTIMGIASLGMAHVDEIAEFVGCEYEDARDDHIPAILKALGGQA